MQPYHHLFIHSDLGSQSDSLGPLGEASIIRRVVLSGAAPGQMVEDRNTLPYDYVTVARGGYRTMSFSIRDYEGREVDMSHLNISFSILFIKFEDL